MRNTNLILFTLLATSLLCIMPQSESGLDLDEIIFDIANSFNVDIYVSSPKDTNTVVYVDSALNSWVICVDGQSISQDNMNLIQSLQKMENWTSEEIEDLWVLLNDMENQTNEDIGDLWNLLEGSEELVAGKISILGDKITDLNGQIKSKIDLIEEDNYKNKEELNDHRKILKVLYNRTEILKNIFSEFQSGYFIFVNETNANISKLQENVSLLKIDITDLEEDIISLNDYIGSLESTIDNLESTVTDLEENINSLQSLLLIILGGGGLIAICIFYANKRYPFEDIFKNGKVNFKNGKQLKIAEFIPHEQLKADKKADRKLRLEARKAKKEEALQQRKEKLLAKKAARAKVRSNKKSERVARLHAKQKQKAYKNLTKTIDGKLTKINNARYTNIKKKPKKSPLRYLFSFLFSNK